MFRSTKSAPRARRFSARMPKRCADALKPCSGSEVAVRRDRFPKAAGAKRCGRRLRNDSLQQTVAIHLNSFRHVGRLGRIETAVALAVAKIEDEADQKPDDQSQPVRQTEHVDHSSTRNNSED